MIKQRRVAFWLQNMHLLSVYLLIYLHTPPSSSSRKKVVYIYIYVYIYINGMKLSRQKGTERKTDKKKKKKVDSKGGVFKHKKKYVIKAYRSWTNQANVVPLSVRNHESQPGREKLARAKSVDAPVGSDPWSRRRKLAHCDWLVAMLQLQVLNPQALDCI